MSCFWTTLLNKIKKEDIHEILGLYNPTLNDFVDALKSKNCKTENVLWNMEELNNQAKEENIKHIKEYDTHTISNGYLCSTCDPFLLLITELFHIEIIHHYTKSIITYQNNISNNYTIKIHNNQGHMW
tara:strand:- start:664 stop:1047 length:384 start_codon:yes stop_codon:yes gene_type:complete